MTVNEVKKIPNWQKVVRRHSEKQIPRGIHSVGKRTEENFMREDDRGSGGGKPLEFAERQHLGLLVSLFICLFILLWRL